MNVSDIQDPELRKKLFAADVKQNGKFWEEVRAGEKKCGMRNAGREREEVRDDEGG